MIIFLKFSFLVCFIIHRYCKENFNRGDKPLKHPGRAASVPHRNHIWSSSIRLCLPVSAKKTWNLHMDPCHFTRPVDQHKLKEHSKIIETNRGSQKKMEWVFFRPTLYFVLIILKLRAKHWGYFFHLPGDVDVNKSQFHHLRELLRLFCNAESAKRKESRTNRKIRLLIADYSVTVPVKNALRPIKSVKQSCKLYCNAWFGQMRNHFTNFNLFQKHMTNGREYLKFSDVLGISKAE